MSNMLLELIANVFDVICLSILFTRRLLPKYNSFIPTIAFMIVGFALESVPLIWNIKSYPTEIILMIVSIGYLFFFRKGTLAHKVFWVTVSFALIFAIAFTVMPLLSYITQVDTEVIFNQLNFSKRALYLVVVNIIKFTLFYILSINSQKVYQNHISIFLCLVIPIISVTSAIFIHNIFLHDELETISDKIILIVAVSYMLINVFTFVLYELIQREAEKTMYLIAKDTQRETMEAYTNQIKEINSNIRVWQHDMKEHLSCLRVLLEKNEIDEAKKYFNKLSVNIASSYLIINSGNPVVDAVLSSKISSAVNKGIKVDCSASLPDKISVDEVDLCSILSNVFENAIEAATKVSESPFINCNILVVKKQLLIGVENSSTGYYKIKGETFETIKGSGIHGLGLKNTRSIVDKYEGICSINAASTSFKIEIYIPLS